MGDEEQLLRLRGILHRRRAQALGLRRVRGQRGALRLGHWEFGRRKLESLLPQGFQPIHDLLWKPQSVRNVDPRDPAADEFATVA